MQIKAFSWRFDEDPREDRPTIEYPHNLSGLSGLSGPSGIFGPGTGSGPANGITDINSVLIADFNGNDLTHV